MSKIYDVFSKELDTQIVSEYKLGGDVFSQTEVDKIELLVGRQEEAKRLGIGLRECFNGSKDKILIHGPKGVGKSSLLVLIEEREEKEGDILSVDLSAISLTKDEKEARFYILYTFAEKFLSFLHNQRGSDKNEGLIRDLISLLETIVKEKDIQKESETIKNLDFYPADSYGNSDILLVSGIIKRICERCECAKKIVAVFDDFHKTKKMETIQFVSSISKNTNITPLLIMPSDEYLQLDEQFLKNAFIIEVPPMKNTELMEILHKRIINYRKASQSENRVYLSILTNNFDAAILPFQKNTLDYLASLSFGIPLDFILRSEAAYNTMCEKNEKQVTPEMVSAKIEHAPPQATKPLVTLTEREFLVFSFVKRSSTGIKTEEIKREIEQKIDRHYRREYVTMLLTRLLIKGAVRKERRGQFVIYFPKQEIEVELVHQSKSL